MSIGKYNRDERELRRKISAARIYQNSLIKKYLEYESSIAELNAKLGGKYVGLPERSLKRIMFSKVSDTVFLICDVKGVELGMVVLEGGVWSWHQQSPMWALELYEVCIFLGGLENGG
jgi:hypothetical protein